MGCGVHFFATREDEERLLDFLGEPSHVQLFPWIAMPLDNPVLLDRSSIWDLDYVGAVNPAFGGLCLLGTRSCRRSSVASQRTTNPRAKHRTNNQHADLTMHY